jgi:hypothetical protein
MALVTKVHTDWLQSNYRHIWINSKALGQQPCIMCGIQTLPCCWAVKAMLSLQDMYTKTINHAILIIIQGKIQVSHVWKKNWSQNYMDASINWVNNLVPYSRQKSVFLGIAITVKYMSLQLARHVARIGRGQGMKKMNTWQNRGRNKRWALCWIWAKYAS